MTQQIGEGEALSLPATYARAQEALDQHAKDASPAAYQRALQSLRLCQQMVEAQGLFSSNEEAEDIPTAHLKYLLLPASLGELLAGARARDPTERAAAVTAALAAFREMLLRCEQYGLLGEGGRASFHATEDGTPLDPTSRRNAKLERHKRGTAVKALLAHLEHQRGGGDDDAAEEVSGYHSRGGRESRAGVCLCVAVCMQRQCQHQVPSMPQHTPVVPLLCPPAPP